MLALMLFAAISHAQWFDHQELDYWGDGGNATNARALEIEEDVSIRSFDSLPFDWDAYSNPSDVRFWDDGGDYVPPLPLRVVAADPSAENIERYRDWMQRKLALTQQVHLALWGKREAPNTDLSPIDWSSVHIVYFYQTGCQHCERSLPTIQSLRQSGAQVYPVYLNEPSPELPNSTPYTAQMRRALPVEGTPTWVLQHGDERTQIQGYASLAQIAAQIRTLMQR